MARWSGCAVATCDQHFGNRRETGATITESRLHFVVNYYTTGEWAKAATDTPNMTTTNVLMRPIELGLRNGTEKTMQVLAAILMTINQGSVAKAMERSSTIKHETLKYVKEKLKAHAGNIATWIPSLPEDPQELRAQQPQIFNTLYPNDPPVMSPFPGESFSSLVVSIPMRCSNVKVRNVMYPSTNHQLVLPPHSQGHPSQWMDYRWDKIGRASHR